MTAMADRAEEKCVVCKKPATHHIGGAHTKSTTPYCKEHFDKEIEAARKRRKGKPPPIWQFN